MRYVIAFLAMAGCTVMYGLRTVLSICIVPMTTEIDVEITKVQQGVILSAFYYGYVICMIPGSIFTIVVGPTLTLGIGVLASSLLSFASPFVFVQGGYLPFVILRILIGAFESITFSAVFSIMSNWSPTLERTRMLSLGTSGQYLGLIISLPLSSLLISTFGWTMPFYVFGGSGIVWFFIWIVVASDTPERNKFVSETEKNYIRQFRDVDREFFGFRSVPWKVMFKSKALYAIGAVHICEMWGFYTMITELPKYLKIVLKFDMNSVGLISVLPFVLQISMSIITSMVIDLIRQKNLVETSTLRKLCTCFAFLLQALFLFLTGSSRSVTNVIIFFTIGIGIGGVNYSGYYANILDIAPDMSGIIIGFVNCLGSLSGVLSPILTEVITSKDTVSQWADVFYISAGLYLLGSVVYAKFAESKLNDSNEYEEVEE